MEYIKQFKNMITTEQIEDWMMDNGEDHLQEGPLQTNSSLQKEFVEKVKSNTKIINQLIKEEIIDDVNEIYFSDLTISNDEKLDRLILSEYVDFLNSKNISI